MAFELVWEPRGVYKRFYGYVTDTELMDSVVTIESDARFDGLRFVINDFLGVEGFAVSEDNILTISAIDNAASRTNPNIKIAVVATDQRVHDLANIYADSPLNAYPTAIFPTPDAARTWLGGFAAAGQ